MFRMDYFNDKEYSIQRRFAKKRDAFLAPLVGFLRKAGIKPAYVSLFGIAVCAVIIAIPSHLWWVSAALMILYVFADGLDGPLARATTGGTSGGALLDILSDQVGVFFVAIAAINWLGVIPQFQLSFSLLYILCIVSMVVVNAVKEKLAYTLRVKYIYFILFIVASAASSPIILDIFCAIFSIYYMVMFSIHFKSIVKFLDSA